PGERGRLDRTADRRAVVGTGTEGGRQRAPVPRLPAAKGACRRGDRHQGTGLPDPSRARRARPAPLRAARRGGGAVAPPARREALALWRGPALADVAHESFAQAEILRLEELRLIALERRVDADLALGRGAVLVAELEALVREHPLRERLRAQLMLALYRSGRQ